MSKDRSWLIETTVEAIEKEALRRAIKAVHAEAALTWFGMNEAQIRALRQRYIDDHGVDPATLPAEKIRFYDQS